MRKRVNKWIGSICWDIGDWFMGQYFKRIDRDEMKNWTQIDVHANCMPKSYLKPTFMSSTMPVSFTATNSTATSWFVDWDSLEDSAYDDK